MQRKDYTFAELLAMEDPPSKNGKQTADDDFIQESLFGEELQESTHPNDEGRFLQQYIAHYQHIQEDDARLREIRLQLNLQEEEMNNG